MRGTNIGGWMVLEPWITPSLFYRFLGKKHSDGIGRDSSSFCEALGPEEGNRVMKAHWKSWVTEEHIKELKEKEVEIVRLPIGDWTLKPYGPYVGCMDGAKDEIKWFLDMCEKYGIKVLLDVHAVKGSQNGFDNSGVAHKTVWLDEDHYEHWGFQRGEWMGPWNGDSYDYIDFENLAWAVNTMDGLLDEWGHHPAVYAMEPVNEPWEHTDLWALKLFYRNVRALMRRKNPELVFVFHESFRYSADIWNDLFEDDDLHNVILDTHIYQAWDASKASVKEVCDKWEEKTKEAEKIKYPVWVGEWALGTDACAFWLDGFNDSKTPRTDECMWVECPKTYLPDDVAVDMDRTAYMQGPFGSNLLDVAQYGMCPTDSDRWTDKDMLTNGQCVIKTFDKYAEAHFMWNFRTELEPKWSYVDSYDKGWTKPIKRQEFLQ